MEKGKVLSVSEEGFFNLSKERKLTYIKPIFLSKITFIKPKIAPQKKAHIRLTTKVLGERTKLNTA